MPTAADILIAQAPGQITVGVDAAVAEEGPMGAGHVHFVEIARDDERFLFVDAGFSEDSARGIGDEALAPEFDAVAADGLFKTDAIGHRDEAAVRDGMTALDHFPGAVLVFAVFGFFFWMPTDGGGIKENLSAL